MSEKPVASIKTLARYEPDTVYIGTGEYVAECVRADDGDYYLAADVDAAIEALLEERDRLAAALEAAQMGLRYAVRVWVLSDEIRWSEEEIDEVVESIIGDAKKEASNG